MGAQKISLHWCFIQSTRNVCSVQCFQWLPTANRLKAPSLARPSTASASDLHTLSQSLCLIHSFISPFILNTDSLPLLMLQKMSLAQGLWRRINNTFFCSQRSNNAEEDKNVSQNHKKHCLWQWGRCLFRAEQEHREGGGALSPSGIRPEENPKCYTEKVASPVITHVLGSHFNWKQCPEESQRSTDQSVLREL